MEKNIENSIKSAIDGILSAKRSKVLVDNKDEIESMLSATKLNDPEGFYFKNSYDNYNKNELVIEVLAESKGYSPSGFFSSIYLNYSDIEFYVSNLISKELGYVCSTDKARFVIKKVLEKHLTGYSSIRNKEDRKGYWDPFSRRFSDWEKLILTCPIINNSQAEEHARHLILFIDKIRKAKETRLKFINNFSKWILSQEYRKEKCELSNGKVMTYEEMFNKNPEIAYDWLSVKSKHIIKIYKKII